MALNTWGGRAWFDRSGKASCTPPIAPAPASFPSDFISLFPPEARGYGWRSRHRQWERSTPISMVLQCRFTARGRGLTGRAKRRAPRPWLRLLRAFPRTNSCGSMTACPPARCYTGRMGHLPGYGIRHKKSAARSRIRASQRGTRWNIGSTAQPIP